MKPHIVREDNRETIANIAHHRIVVVNKNIKKKNGSINPMGFVLPHCVHSPNPSFGCTFGYGSICK